MSRESEVDDSVVAVGEKSAVELREQTPWGKASKGLVEKSSSLSESSSFSLSVWNRKKRAGRRSTVFAQKVRKEKR